MKKRLSNRFKNKCHELSYGSFFIRILITLTNRIYQALEHSLIGNLLSSYPSDASECRSRCGKTVSEKLSLSSKIRNLKIATAKSFENSRILAWLQSVANFLLRLSIRSYSIAFLSFGSYCIILYYIINYLKFDISVGKDRLYIGIFLVICAIPALFSKKGLAHMLSGSTFGHIFLFGVAGIRKYSLENVGPSVHKNNASFIVGMAAGLLTVFVSPFWILFGIIGIIGAALICHIPELGIVMLFLTLPFLPTMLLAALICFLFFAYMLKYIRGKRNLRFDSFDRSVVMFCIFVLVAGLFSVDTIGSIKVALLWLCFLCGYFLCVNLISNALWAKRCIGVMLTSTLIVAAYGILQYLSGSASTSWQDTKMFSDISGRVVSTFENPNVLGEFLILTTPFFFALTLNAKRMSEKALSFFMTCVCIICLVFTWSRGAWLGFMFGMVLFLLIYSRKAMILLVAGLCTIPSWPFILPESIINRFTSIGNISDSSTSFRVNIWKGSIRMIESFFLSGVGLGINSFQKIYPDYSLPAIESAPHAHNLYLELLAEIGVFGLLSFLVCMLIFTRSNFNLFRKPNIIKSNRLFVIAGFCGIFAILLQGLTDYVWYNYRLFLMFWLVVGLTAAMRKLSTANSGAYFPQYSIES